VRIRAASSRNDRSPPPAEAGGNQTDPRPWSYPELAKAQAASDKALREHEEQSETLVAERAAIEERIEAEDARWDSERQRLMKAAPRPGLGPKTSPG